MEDIFKKVLGKGLEIMDKVTEQIKESVEDFTENSQAYTAKGEALYEEFKKDWSDQQEENQGKLKATIDKVLSKFDLATKEEVAELKERLRKLEEEID